MLITVLGTQILQLYCTGWSKDTVSYDDHLKVLLAPFFTEKAGRCVKPQVLHSNTKVCTIYLRERGYKTLSFHIQ